MEKTFGCKECGTQLPSKERLRKHERIHKEPAWKDADYVDPNNAQYTTFSNISNNKIAFAVSKILDKNEEGVSKKRAKK